MPLENVDIIINIPIVERYLLECFADFTVLVDNFDELKRNNELYIIFI